MMDEDRVKDIIQRWVSQQVVCGCSATLAEKNQTTVHPLYTVKGRFVLLVTKQMTQLVWRINCMMDKSGGGVLIKLIFSYRTYVFPHAPYI